MDLKGKTALITGSCGAGMGRSTALRLVREGARIVLNYGTHRHGAEVRAHADRIAEAIGKLGGQAIVQEADTRNEQQVQAIVEAACKAFGHVDILVNNAGGDWDVRDYANISLDHWKAVLSAEVDGAFLTMKHVVPGMREGQWGRIIHIGLAGALRMTGVNGVAPDYCLGKAVRSWMTTAFGAQELGKRVTVNCIEPGLTAHMSFEDALKAASGEYSSLRVTALDPGSSKQLWSAAWHERETPTCHDIAEAIAFLCSDAGRFISGNNIQFPFF